MQIEVTATVDVDRPRDEAFDFAVACETFPRVLRKLGLIPAIEHVEMVDGQPLATGGQRRVRLGDGSEIRELVVALDRPLRHRYRWLDLPAAPFNLLVSGAEADWTFDDTRDGGTRIAWTYAFTLTTPLVYPLARLVLGLFRSWMQRGLDRIAEQLRAR